MTAKSISSSNANTFLTSQTAFFQNAPLGFILADSDYRIRSANETFSRWISASESSIVNKSLTEIFSQIWLYMEPQCQRAVRGDATLNQELQFKTGNSRNFTWLVSYSPIMDKDDVVGFSIVLNDISDRKAIEQHRQIELARISRLSTTLSRINQSITVSQTRDELFAKVTQVLCEQGGFPQSWIGWHSPETKTLVHVAQWGIEKNKNAFPTISTEQNKETMSPSIIALTTQRPHICHDIDHVPSSVPWRDVYERFGLKSSAAFPIRENGVVSGVLCVYAAEPEFFKDKEVTLLADAVQDISFALDSFVQGRARVHAESTAKNERTFSDAMIESMPGILYFYDDQGRFLRWNQNMERVSGYSGAEISTMHPLDFFRPEEKLIIQKRIGEVFKSGEAMVEASFLTKDGRAIPYVFTGKRLQVNGTPCLVGVGIDVTDRKIAEEALKELNGSLEVKVETRTQELQAARVRAESADRVKSAFLATMSHELRTPLNSILGFTGIVLQGLAGPLTAEQTKQLGMVRGSARHLLDLINDILDISKIEANQLEIRPETFDVRESLERAVALVKPLADKKNIPLISIINPSITEWSNDRRRMEQIFINLINNAVKFTERGQVTVMADIIDGYTSAETKKSGPALRLRVKDTGIGVKSENLNLLFQPFRQVDSSLARQHEGTGLGLAICRRLALLMGGEISATSEWSKGSEFTVIIPKKEVSAR